MIEGFSRKLPTSRPNKSEGKIFFDQIAIAMVIIGGKIESHVLSIFEPICRGSLTAFLYEVDRDVIASAVTVREV